MSDCTSGMRVQREGEGGVGGAVRGWSGHWSGTVGDERKPCTSEWAFCCYNSLPTLV